MDAHGWRRDRNVPGWVDPARGRPPPRHAKRDGLCGRHARGRRFHPRRGRGASDGRRRSAPRGCRGRSRPGRLGWRVVDVYAWGDSSYTGAGWTGRAAERPGRGEVAVRAPDGNGAWIDRDTADDWEGLRHHRLGQSAFDPGPMELRGATTAVLSP